MRQTSYAARGYPERAYAKWLTLNFAWKELDPLCQKRGHATAFREACERDTAEVVVPLQRALNAVFVAALRFYRANRGSGPTALDVSLFFKRRDRHKEFARFWRASENTARPAFDRAWARFRKALDEQAAK